MRSNIITIVPCYNEEHSIIKVINLIKDFGTDILIINDGSNDNTKNIVRASSVKYISFKRNMGNSFSLLKGFEYAVNNNYLKIITIDGDLAHNPSEIPQLLNKYDKSKCQLCIGNRFNSNFLKHIPTPKIYSNFFATHLFNKIMNTRFKDVSCGFRAIDVGFIKHFINKNDSKGFSLVYDMLIFALINRYHISTVPVTVHYDARELFCTPQNELFDFIKSLLRIKRINENLRAELLKLKKSIKTFKEISVLVDDLLLYLKPINNYKSYIFQKQDEMLLKLNTYINYNLKV